MGASCMKDHISIKQTLQQSPTAIKRKPKTLSIHKSFQAYLHQKRLVVNNQPITNKNTLNNESTQNPQCVKFMKIDKTYRTSHQFNVILNFIPRTVSQLNYIDGENNLVGRPHVDDLSDLNLQECLQTNKNRNVIQVGVKQRVTQTNTSDFQIPYVFSYIVDNPLLVTHQVDGNQKTQSQILPKIKQIQRIKVMQNKRETAPIQFSFKPTDKIQPNPQLLVQQFNQSNCNVVVDTKKI